MKAFYLAVLFSVILFSSYGQDFTLVNNDPSATSIARSYGVALVDADLDGDLDIFSTSVSNQNNEFFINNGDGSFSTTGSNILSDDGSYTYGTSWGDYDNDGDLDCFVSNRNQKNQLYRNDNGVFTEIISGNIVNDIGNSRSGIWADYDNDGCLDLYVTNQSQSANYLYRNLCDGTFERIYEGAMVTDSHNSYGCMWTDMDKDGDLDLLVLNTQQNNDLYENNGNGTFTSNTTSVLVQNGIGEWNHGAAWGDVDNDMDLDLYISNVSGSNYLFINEGDFNFTLVTAGDAVTDMGETTGNAWFDMDNDGDQDLIATNRLGADNRLYENDGSGLLTSTQSNITIGGDSRGVAIGDLDGNGTQDVYIANEFENNFLYLNNDTQNYWFSISLVGTISNRSAIGAKVSVQANIWDKHVWKYQEITTQTGYLSQGSLTADFGMGDAWVVDTIIIEWPSGLVCELVNIPSNQTITIVENCDFTPVNVKENNLPNELNIFPNPSQGMLNYQFYTSTDFTIEVFDLFGETHFFKNIRQENAAIYEGQLVLPDNLKSGMYFIRFVNNSRSTTNRFMLSR